MDIDAVNLAFEMAITRAMSWHPSETGPSYEETRAQVRRELLAALPAQEWQPSKLIAQRIGKYERDLTRHSTSCRCTSCIIDRSILAELQYMDMADRAAAPRVAIIAEERD